MYQLRGEKGGIDTGEIIELDSLEDAMECFLAGGWWKLSWQRPNGKRVRLLKVGPDTIQITDPGAFVTGVMK